MILAPIKTERRTRAEGGPQMLKGFPPLQTTWRHVRGGRSLASCSTGARRSLVLCGRVSRPHGQGAPVRRLARDAIAGSDRPCGTEYNVDP